MPLDWSRASFRCQDVDHNTNVDQGGMVHLEKRKEKRNLISFINFMFYESLKAVVFQRPK